jgi:hypothetical protein
MHSPAPMPTNAYGGVPGQPGQIINSRGNNDDAFNSKYLSRLLFLTLLINKN